jgi:hypothetical protein
LIGMFGKFTKKIKSKFPSVCAQINNAKLFVNY